MTYGGYLSMSLSAVNAGTYISEGNLNKAGWEVASIAADKITGGFARTTLLKGEPVIMEAGKRVIPYSVRAAETASGFVAGDIGMSNIEHVIKNY
ncbi:hypothetical protein KSK37_13700 [Kaistella sp. DKR-2]|uniref:hypothetical protein n=1 Tax=Kaistella soli TaxID=2849654 RepID=UPI001C27BACE|nr:hypothetical protein [Kaistella soli]MBU8884142.1 hypothetical protein [Kaistella soli]